MAMSNGKMSTARMEAFSDGVIAIIVTVMVLQLAHPSAHVSIYISYFLYVLVPATYFVPERKLVDDTE